MFEGVTGFGRWLVTSCGGGLGLSGMMTYSEDIPGLERQVIKGQRPW